jgi:Ca2+-binding RTX toxin-like protein
MALLTNSVTLLGNPVALLEQDDHTAGRDVYNSHADAWKKLRFVDPDHPTDPKPADKLYHFINGDSGNNLLDFGTNGDDVYRGGHGMDHFRGKGGNDHIFGQNGADYLEGEKGNDHIYGGAGNDSGFGGDGNDTMWGDAGVDVFYGDQGTDVLHGGTQGDFLHGGAGADQIYGEDDRDWLYGDKGDDFLYGGKGDDWLYGGKGNDHLYGGEGKDVFVFDKKDSGYDTIYDYDAKKDDIDVNGVKDKDLHHEYKKGDTYITWGDHDSSIKLVGVHLDDHHIA